MTDYYMDTDTGDDADDGSTWALAKLTIEGLVAVMAAGDRGFIQGAAADTDTVDRIIASPGVGGNPCLFIGCADGTTAEPPTESDIASTQPLVQATGATGDVIFTGDGMYVALNFETADRMNLASNSDTSIFRDCILKYYDQSEMDNSSLVLLFDTAIDATGQSGSQFQGGGHSIMRMYGGSVTVHTSWFKNNGTGDFYFYGVTFSATVGDLNIHASSGTAFGAWLINCKLPATYDIYGTGTLDITAATGKTTIISSNDTASVANSDSIQDYESVGPLGTTDLEVTAVRTGGADDQATGAFSYAMVLVANAAREGIPGMPSPDLRVWVDGGSSLTATVYIANSSASTDYIEDEVSCVFFSPAAVDAADHDMNWEQPDPTLGSAAITDDTGSTWGTGANNHQKFSITVTPGFSGWLYATVFLNKRQATPDTLYIDPKIEIT